MISFKRSDNIQGKIKNIVVTGDMKFADSETGERIDLAEILFTVFDGEPFDMAVAQKKDKDVTPTDEE